MERRRAIAIFVCIVGFSLAFASVIPKLVDEISSIFPASSNINNSGPAITALEELEVKGRAPKTGYSRDEFGGGWLNVNGCSTRQLVLYRDLREVILDKDCKVVSGILDDPYTGEIINYNSSSASDVQIDHVIALSDAWQKGAQQLSPDERKQLANDPLELIAVSGPANQQKSDGDAATWLPSNKPFRCQYVARQIAVKKKYRLWVTTAEKEAMKRVLGVCPEEPLPVR